MLKRFGDARDWFFEKRFGLFVHWGLYSINGWHEQDQWRRRIPRKEYVKLQNQWNPVRFDPEAWLDLMGEVGMKYITLTTKHHDGFCLFDSKLTNYTSAKSPYGKDIVKMLADACHRRGVPLCLYYSCADWHQKYYPNQGRHHEIPAQAEDEPSLPKYIEFLKGQVRELCTNYGPIHGIWWDMNVDKLVDRSINAMIRELQPAAVINNRGYDEGDFGTPERDYEKDDSIGFDRPTEANNSVGTESWGYRVDEDYYTDRHLIRSIDKYLARDANYLLNVGPKPDGTIPEESVGILRRVGRWYQKVKESFAAEPCSRLTDNRNVLLTKRENVLYVHLHKEPIAEGINLKPLNVAPLKATLLNTGQAAPFVVDMFPWDHVEQRPFLHLQKLPANTIVNEAMVVKLEFDRPIDSLVVEKSTKKNDVNRR